MEQQYYSPEWDGYVSAASKKIDSFSELPKGWHYGDGEAALKDVIDAALKIEAHLRMIGFSHTDAFPGADGEIMVVGYRGDHDLEVTLIPGDEFEIIHVVQRQDGEPVVAHGLDKAKNEIARLGRNIWESLGLSMGSISTTIAKNSKASPSSQALAGELQFYAKTASSRAVEVTAATSTFTMTMESLGIPLSTGAFQPKRTRRRAA